MLAELLAHARLDGFDPRTQLRQFSTEGFKRRQFYLGGGVAGTAPERDVPEVILREAQRARDRRQGRTRALPVNPLLDLTQRGGRDPRGLCKLSLGDPSFPHPVVDDPRDRGPVAHCTLLTRD
jgi:hypothetical protein